MTEPLRPLNMGGILDRAIQGYREKFSLFAGLAVFPGLTQLAVGLAAVHPKTTTDPSGGHIALVKGVFDSFTALPLLSVSVSRPLLDTITSIFGGLAHHHRRRHRRCGGSRGKFAVPDGADPGCRYDSLRSPLRAVRARHSGMRH